MDGGSSETSNWLRTRSGLPGTLADNSIGAMPDEEVHRPEVIFVGYGTVMLAFQLLEMSLWRLQTRNLNSGISMDQALQKLNKWTETTFGGLMRGLRTQDHWPPELLDRLLDAVQLRNYLAHHFLRDFMMVKPSASATDAALDELIAMSQWVEQLGDDLSRHLVHLGIPGDEPLDAATQAEVDALRPTSWPLILPE